MSKIIGVTIDTKSPNTKNKIYYYKTDNDYKRGDQVDINVPNGGTPTATVVIQNSKKSFDMSIKKLDVKK